MRKHSFGMLVPCCLVVAALSCEKKNSEPPEAVLFTDTIQWQWELGEWYGGNSFYWWHRTDNGVQDYGELPPTDWTKPRDFEHGSYHMRFEILDQPTDSSFMLQLGFWQDKDKEGGHSETVSPRVLLEGGTGTLVESDLGVPAEWWQLREDAPVDFSRPEDLYMIGLALWKAADPICIPMAQGWNNSQSCPNAEQAALEFFPMKARVTIVAVAAGHTFSGWENYP
jgi:hypothetical protein